MYIERLRERERERERERKRDRDRDRDLWIAAASLVEGSAMQLR